MRRRISLMLLACLVFLLASPAQAERRVALVIGNAAYPSAPLKNPVNDATDMAASLRKLGFEVSFLKDATMPQMETAVREFGLKLRQGGVGLFYYAGHGIQVAGNNYLVPVNAVIQSESDVKYGCLDAGLVLGKMEDAQNGLNLIILDACRNNPFARSFRSADKGLAKMDAPTGSLIAYATAPGNTAADGEGRNGLYTQHLLKNIATPGLSVEELFKRVRQGVAGESAKKQVPWEASSLIGQFSFAGGQQVASIGAGAAAPSISAPAVSPAPAAAVQPASKPLDLKAEKKRLADEAAQLKREKEELAQLQALNAEKARLEAERQKVEQAKLLAMAPAPKQPPQPAAPLQAPVGSPSQTWRDPVTGMEFVWVPSGCFQMGSFSSESGRFDNEGPVHEVCVSGLWVGKYTVTNAEYRKFKPGHDSMNYRGLSLNQDRQPAVSVSWEDAKVYADWLSSKGNGKFRLLTEAEWEYAARAGTTTSRFWGDSPDAACRYANVHDQTSKRTNASLTWEAHNCDDGYAVAAPVGSFRPNAYGLYDMLGNVWQWCEDVYDKNAYASHSRDNPTYTGGGSERVHRGGSWADGPRGVRSSNRLRNSPGLRSLGLGFRLARTN